MTPDDSQTQAAIAAWAERQADMAPPLTQDQQHTLRAIFQPAQQQEKSA